MVAPSNSLLLLYDDAQSIYGKKRSRAFSFAKMGIQARGRTTILRVNYRNSAEVLEYAYSFAKEVLTPEEIRWMTMPFPLSVGKQWRHGRVPTLTQCNSLPDEARHIAQQLRLLHAQGCNGRTWPCCIRRSSSAKPWPPNYARNNCR
jgi:superfamily I DNA/RNA helicase